MPNPIIDNAVACRRLAGQLARLVGRPEDHAVALDALQRRLAAIETQARLQDGVQPSTTWRPERPKKPVADPAGVFQHLAKRERRG